MYPPPVTCILLTHVSTRILLLAHVRSGGAQVLSGVSAIEHLLRSAEPVVHGSRAQAHTLSLSLSLSTCVECVLLADLFSYVLLGPSVHCSRTKACVCVWCLWCAWCLSTHFNKRTHSSVCAWCLSTHFNKRTHSSVCAWCLWCTWCLCPTYVYKCVYMCVCVSHVYTHL
jgi:hypothetical protein